MELLDLSHTIEENMTLLGSLPKPKIAPFFDCGQSTAFNRGGCLRGDQGGYGDEPGHEYRFPVSPLAPTAGYRPVALGGDSPYWG